MLGVLVGGTLIALAVLTAGVGVWVHRVGRGRAASLFVVCMCVNTLWMLTASASVLVTTTGALETAIELRAMFAMLSGLVFFLFVLEYTGRSHWLTTPVRVGIGLLAAVFVTVPLTNRWTGFIGRDLTLVEEPITHADLTLGPLSLPLFGMSSTFTVAALLLVGYLFVRSRHATRLQSGLLFGAVLISFVVITGQMLELLPYPMIPYTPMTLGALAVCVGVAMFRNQLFVAEPVARSSVVEQIRDPVIVLNSAGRLIDYNAAADRTFGPLTIGERLRTQLPELFASPDEEETPSTTDHPYAAEITAEIDGCEEIYSVDRSALDVRGQRGGEALVFRNITDRKAYERQLEQQTDQLEQIASTISHDLRNPLSVATGNVELAAETGDIERLDTARDSLERMDDIITDVLALSREGTRVVNSETVSVKNLVDDAWATSETKAATLVTETVDVEIEADPGRVRRLLENVFRNSVEHGSTSSQRGSRADDSVDHGGDDVTVWVGIDEDRFYVEDNGPGVPESEREQIFEHGYTTESGNTGFGLDIVASIAEAHGWTVSVEEGRDGGAKFVFEGIDVIDSIERSGDLKEEAPSG